MRCIMLIKSLLVLPMIMERKKAVVTCNEGDVGIGS